jgi:hypothetical protein
MRGLLKCIDKDYNIIYCSKDDERLTSGIVVPITKKYITAKDADGKTHVVFNNDERLKDGTLFPATSKHIVDCPIHGRQQISYFKGISNVQIPEKFKVYCPKCREYYLSNEYVPTTLDIEECILALNQIHFCSSNQQVPKYFKSYMPQFLRIIENFSIPGLPSDTKFSFKLYLLKNRIAEIPTCAYKSCTNRCEILTSTQGFTLHCKEHENLRFSSNAENEIYEFLISIYDGKIEKNYRKFKNKEIDIYLPDLNIGIEFNGLYWHSEKYLSKTYHKDKQEFFNELGIKLITVWEDQWNFKRSIVQSILRSSIQKNSLKLDARKCTILPVSSKDKELFLDSNHIQGNCASRISLGLNHENELVSIMTFGRTRLILGSKNSSKSSYELLRFCSKLDHTVRGAASKLFTHFINEFHPDSVLSYSNLDVNDGHVYEVLGFTCLGVTEPTYWWSDNVHRYHRSAFMKHKLVKDGADPAKTETEIMHDKNYSRIWGCGNKKWLWISTSNSLQENVL